MQFRHTCYHRKGEELSHDIRYNSNTHGFHEFYALFFARKQASILTLQQSVLLPCIRQQIKGDKAMKTALFFYKQKAARSKIHRYALHSHYKYKQMSWRKNDEEERMPDLRLGNVFQLPSRRISRRWTRSGTNLVIFLEALCAQTNLFWREMKINKMYTET